LLNFVVSESDDEDVNRHFHRPDSQVKQRRGSTLVYVAVSMVAFAAIASMAIDLAHVRMVKMQLQFAADSAARYAVTGISTSTSASRAISAAGAVTVDGSNVVINSSDVVVGTWSGSAFTAGGSTPNAVKVTAARTAARGNATSLWWGSLFGKNSADVTVTSIAYGRNQPTAGFIGYAGIYYKNNSFYGGYDSRVTTLPTQSTATGTARLGTNTVMIGYMNNVLNGNAVLGPTASSPQGIQISGSTQVLSTNLPIPSMPNWNPPSAPTDLVVSTATTLPAGYYWFNSITTTANLSFSGPSVVYVNGPISIDANMGPTSGSPRDLFIYQYGTTTFGDGLYNGMNLTASVIAPYSDFLTKNNLNFYGSGVFNTITTKNNANFYYDTNLGLADGSSIISTVK
jgi:putative Flp pilus-assembly TadE/G-like protein